MVYCPHHGGKRLHGKDSTTTLFTIGYQGTTRDAFSDLRDQVRRDHDYPAFFAAMEPRSMLRGYTPRWH